MEKQNLRSQALDLLRFPLAVVVLSIHVFSTAGFTVQGNFVAIDDMSILVAINHAIDGFLRGQSVPVYFFISGFVFFLSGELTKEVYAGKLKNRVKSLLIPFLIWNALALLEKFLLYLPCFSSLLPNLHSAQIDLSLTAILNTFWDTGHGVFPPVSPAENNSIYPENFPLWFVRDLMIVVLCVPVIYRMLKRAKHYPVLVLGAMWFVLGYWDFGHLYQLLTAFFFFSWGAYMSVNGKDMLHEFGRFFRPSVVLYPALALLYVVAAYLYPDACATIKRLNVFVGLFFAYNLAAWLLASGKCKVNKFLASASFFIYVAHGLICGYLLKLLYYLFRPSAEWTMIFLYFFIVFFTVALLLALYYLLEKFTPNLLRVIAGKR